MTAYAETIYTVTLYPGKGTGSPITYSSNEGDIAADWRSAGDCQFYYENGAVCFRLSDSFCPDSFIAPEGYLFYKWDCSSQYNTLTAAETTFTAKWKPDASARITMTSEVTVGTFDENGRAPVTVEVTELDFGPDCDPNADVTVTFNSCDFQGNGGTISSNLSRDAYGTPGRNVSKAFNQTKSYTFFVCIDPEVLAAAAPGTYTGNIKIVFTWFLVVDGVDVPVSSNLKLTLVVPEPASTTHTVTVNNGKGDGSFAEGASVTITADAPENGKVFDKWTTTTEGVTFADANSATTSFTMPAKDVSVTATYKDVEPVYTVTLCPGNGTGSPITYSSNEGDIAADWRSAGDCQFYYENGAVCFRLRDEYCPDSFLAPEGYLFDGWESNNVYNTLTAVETTFTAKWKRDATARISITSEATVGTFDENGRAPVTVEVTELDFGPDCSSAACVYVLINACDFQGNGGTISSNLSENYETPRGSVGENFNQTGSFTFFVCIDPEVLAAAVPGTYTGNMDISFGWDDVANDVDRPVSSNLKLTLVVPEPAPTTHTVTVNNGKGDGSFAEGANVSITADAPENGKVFDKWTTTTEGVTFADANSATTSFTMPAKDVSVTATYKDMETVATPTFSPTGGTYTSAQSVTISCATVGAEIYYTTNGSVPTTGSTKYTGAISVSSTTTINAIAVKDGMINSKVFSATFTIEKSDNGGESGSGKSENGKTENEKTENTSGGANDTQKSNNDNGNNAEIEIFTPTEAPQTEKFEKKDDPVKGLNDIFDNLSSVKEKVEAISNTYKPEEIQQALQTDKVILENIKNLEDLYVSQSGIKVVNEVREELKNIIDENQISVVGAGLNADKGTVGLVLSAPKTEEVISKDEYDYSIQLEIKLVNDGKEVEQLEFPISITIPVPEGIDPEKLEILHYLSDGNVEKPDLIFNNDGTVTFIVTHFSTFVFAEKKDQAETAELNTNTFAGENEKSNDIISISNSDSVNPAESVPASKNNTWIILLIVFISLAVLIPVGFLLYKKMRKS